MKQRIVSLILLLVFTVPVMDSIKAQTSTTETEERIFAFGGEINFKFVQYVFDLTKKTNPKICYLPTASGDNQDNIKYWEIICNKLKVEPIILKVWVSSSEENKSFEDVLLNSDAIVVGGGNTLNMLGIWKAQGIDTILNKALKKGIVLAGGSAGSICWFQNGISDSRPVSLSIVEGLGVLPYSNCPHFSRENRRNLYYQMMEDNKISSGYAMDELAGILFNNGKPVEFVSQSDKHNSYYVSFEEGELKSKIMESRILIMKDALPENSYSSKAVNKKIKYYLDINDREQPLNAYVTETKILKLNKENITESERERVLNIGIEKVFIYNNKFAGVVNDAYLDSFGYGMWYFYNCNDTWTSMGEDIGGATVFESEIKFREKAKLVIKQAEEKLNCS